VLHFLGLGAQKAGTSWLHAMLARHPQIAFPPVKELHFWNRPHTAADVRVYLSRFQDPSRVEGDITPAYALLPVEVIAEVRHAAPALRLLYLIRNPLERAWSSALMALDRAEMTIDEASDRWFLDHFRSAGSLGRGDYEGTIRRWRAVFGDDAVLVLRYEDISTAPAQLLAACFAHLGVESVARAELAAWGLRARVFAGPGLPVRPSLRPVLAALYADRIDSLERYLGWDLSAWKV